jgi:hypothetical protein
MPDLPVTGLTVELRRTADGSSYQFGVVVDDAWLPFAGVKSGVVDDALSVAAELAAQTPPETPTQ